MKQWKKLDVADDRKKLVEPLQIERRTPLLNELPSGRIPRAEEPGLTRLGEG
ncbi:hypothetical protein MA16_Dca023392 [Dendrobium catenatum]|uniref:Uncharacterized protein n=1 Tax=Dendrobium catenatum TaxID=906689 RepID=A0A2I0XAF0_9ASPA|nr:hypothetical protein MA16_Dca023392 [Dendrobium catenatum]